MTNPQLKQKRNLKVKYLGIDVGGTKILIQAFDKKLCVLDEKLVKTNITNGQRGFLEQLYGLIDGFFSKSVKGIGVAVPGIVDQPKGVLVHAPHIPSGKNLKLKSLLEKRYKVQAHADNDINAFLAAEYLNPKVNQYKHVLGVMVGTGVGGAIILNGEIYYGRNGYAGEFGHMVLNLDEKLSTLEHLTGGFYKQKHPTLNASLVKHLGIGLSNLNLIFNPEAIVLGGSVYHNHLAHKKGQLEKIILQYSLSKKAPKLIDANSTTSVAKGAVILMAG